MLFRGDVDGVFAIIAGRELPAGEPGLLLPLLLGHLPRHVSATSKAQVPAARERAHARRGRGRGRRALARPVAWAASPLSFEGFRPVGSTHPKHWQSRHSIMADGREDDGDEEETFHAYTGNAIPWYVRVIWIVFWCGAIAYVVPGSCPLQSELCRRHERLRIGPTDLRLLQAAVPPSWWGSAGDLTAGAADAVYCCLGCRMAATSSRRRRRPIGPSGDANPAWGCRSSSR